MNQDTIARYQGLQMKLKSAGASACLFICLLSIIDEYSGLQHDFVDVLEECMKKNFITSDYYCNDQLEMLEYYTGKKWQREVTKYDTKEDRKTYVVQRLRTRSGGTHFRRPEMDPFPQSGTKFERNYVYRVVVG